MSNVARLNRFKSVLVGSLLLSLCWLSGTAGAAPQAGWWWNPAESGRGFFIESQGGIIYLAGYFYADDGRVRWLVAGGQNADPYHYQGRLLEYRGGQTLFGAYVPPAAPVDMGAIAVDFADDTHGTITWPGGAIPIEREIFDATDTVFQPETGWYWNPAESGSGYSLEVQGNNLFLVGFMYDSNGNPVWYFSAGPLSTPTTYAGSLLQFSDGQTLTGAYHPPGTPANVGTLSLAFTAPNAATLTFNGSGAEATATKDENFTDVAGNKVSIVTRSTVTGLTWSLAEFLGPPLPGATGTTSDTYEPTGGSVSVTVAYSLSNSGIGLQCTGTATQTFPFRSLGSKLVVTNEGEYQLTIGMAAGDLSLDVKATCTVQGRLSAGVTFESATPIKLISDPLVLNSPSFAGSLGPINESPQTTRSGSWFFSETH